MPLGESKEIYYLAWNSRQHRLTPKYYILRSLVTLVKHYNKTLEDYDKQFKITLQRCNGFVTCSGRSRGLLYITFLRAGISTLGQYPGELVPEILYT